MKAKKILIIGLFLSEKNKKIIQRSAADQLAELLIKHHYPVIKTSVYVGKFFRFADTVFTVIKSFNQYSVAIVPLYGGAASLFWASGTTLLLKLLGKNIIIVIHGGSIPQRLQTNEAGGYLKTIKMADVVVCPSGFMMQALNNHGIESVLIENVLNLNDYTFHPKEKFRPNILWMRAFEDVYNPLMAVKLMAALKELYPTAKMLMAGYDRGMYQQTIELAEELKVLDSIEFPGYISNHAKNDYADEYDFYICTNLIDNAPVTLIEMMAMGLPVITVDSGGISFLVENNYNGKLVKYNDVDAMLHEIKNMIENPEDGIRTVVNAREYAKQYDESEVIKKWQHLFNSLN